MLELKTSTGLSLVSFQPYGFSPIMAWVAVGCTICQLQISFKLSLRTHTATYWDPLILGQSNLKEFTLISFWEEAKRWGIKNILLFWRKVLRSGMLWCQWHWHWEVLCQRQLAGPSIPLFWSVLSKYSIISQSTDCSLLFSAHELAPLAKITVE